MVQNDMIIQGAEIPLLPLAQQTLTVLCTQIVFTDAAFIAGISASYITQFFVFDVAILNPGNHYSVSSGQYRTPYKGLYQFTIAFQCRGHKTPAFNLKVDGVAKAFVRNNDDVEQGNSITMTRNIHLEVGQVVSVDVSQMGTVYGNSGYDSWFTGHLIYLSP